MREICTDLDFEINIPGSVMATLDVHPEKGRVRFVEENGRVYLEKAHTPVNDVREEKKAEDKEDYYTDYEKRIKEEFELGSISIEKIDHEWNIKVPDNMQHALGLSEGDHVRFEAVDRETFKISKIR